MNPDIDQASLTRRKWLGLVSTPALAASLGAGALVQKTAAADAPSSASTNDLGARIYNVRDFGAKGDGKTLDTAAVQAAVDACSRDGGGVVLVPAGVFHVGTIELKSYVTLRIAASGTLLGSADGKQYHEVADIPLNGDSTLGDGNWALLFAVKAKNVTIEGPGTIDGQGFQFHSPVRGQTPPSGLGGNRRPYHFLCYHCENVSIRNAAFLESAYHSIRVIQSRRITIDGIYIHNRVNSNNDGFHFISAEHVAISNCTIFCQDDACALFGSCRFVTVTNCTFSTRWSVFRFGGGVAENIAVSNCIMYQVFGCPIKLHGSPGSRFENMSFSNLVFQEVTGPIHISVGRGGRRNPPPGGATASAATAAQDQAKAAPEPAAEPAPADASAAATAVASEYPQAHRGGGPAIVRNLSFSHIHGTVTTNPPQLPGVPFVSNYNPGELHSCIVVNNVGDSIVENISFSDIHLTFGGGGTAEGAARRDLPPIAGEYFMLGAMPAYGFYARNARGLTLDNVRFQVATPDLRPALILDHVEDTAIRGLSVQGNRDAESVLRFIDTKQTYVAGARVLTPSPAFLQLEGEGNEGITLDGGDWSKAAAPLALKQGATEKAVKVRA